MRRQSEDCCKNYAKIKFYQKFLKITQYAHLIVWVPRKGVKLV